MTKKKNSPQKKNPPKLPHGVTEADFLVVLDNISKRLGHKFRFGYHDFDDMKQQAAIFAMEGLEKYDNTRPLENFLWTHVRNRLFNYKRNNYQRPDKPCFTCPFFDKTYQCSSNQCSEYIDKAECKLFSAWSLRNEAKKNIMQPSCLDHDNSNPPDLFFSATQNQELIKILDEHIQADFRENYLKLKHGIKINKTHLSKLQKHISEIMETIKWKNTKSQENEDN